MEANYISSIEMAFDNSWGVADYRLNRDAQRLYPCLVLGFFFLELPVRLFKTNTVFQPDSDRSFALFRIS